MTLRQRRLLAWSVLATFTLLGAAWLLRLDYARKISIDVLDLIPAGERDPELAIVRELAGQAEARTMLFALTLGDGAPARAEAAARFAAELKRSPEFEQVIALADLARNDELGRELFRQRFTLLFPLWLDDRERAYRSQPDARTRFSAWLADDAAMALERFLADPAAPGWQDIIPADPLLLVPRAVERLKAGLSLAAASPGEQTSALVWARIAASPLSEAGQGPAFAAIERAAAAVRGEFPATIVRYTGVNRFAAASRARIQREVAWLNTASLIAVLAVGAIFIRALHRGLHLVPIVLCAMLGASVAVTLAFARVHVVVFVIGAMLVGVAIDYGFYLFLQPPAFAGEDYWAKVRRLLKPLLASCLTTVTGFALLLFSELPVVRQIGVFVSVGLLCALGIALLYFSALENSFLPTRSFAGGAALAPAVRRRLSLTMLALWVAALPGLAFISWWDDIRELEIPSLELRRNDSRLRAMFGGKSAGATYLTRGSTLAGARDALEQFEAWLRRASQGAVQAGNLGAVVPTTSAHARALKFLREEPEFLTRLRAALSTRGFEAAEFAPFFDAYGEHTMMTNIPLENATRALAQKLAGPQSALLHAGANMNWFVTVTDAEPLERPPAETQTVQLSQLQSLNRAFASFRRSAMWLSAAGLALVGAGVMIAYGLRDGLRIFAIPLGACLGVFGLFGWLGHALNMFHLLGAFLGVCLTHDYAIFSATSAFKHEPPPVSVRVSALTTAASFAVLAFSGIPVVRALGVTVAAMVIVALVAIELEYLRPLAKTR